MSYALSAPLQTAVFARLTSDAPLAALVGPAIHDSLPPGPVPDLFVLLGAEVVRGRGDVSGGLAEHDMTISVLATQGGFGAAKRAAAAVSRALTETGLALAEGRVVGLNFLRARALRDGAGRRIDLIFRARVEDV